MRYPNLSAITDKKQCIAIVCNQWGDTGKGKFVDLFSDWADIIIRGTGGSNAGHTLLVDGVKYVFHLLPSGMLHDKDGKINMLGRGVAFDPRVVSEELSILDASHKSHDNLKISYEAPLILPYHLLVDRIDDRSHKVGTTGRGIGPLYADYYARQSLFVNDMLNKGLFAKKLRKFLSSKKAILNSLDKAMAKEVLSHEHLCNGAFSSEKTILDEDAIIEMYTEKFAKELGHYVTDTSKIAKDMLNKGKHVLLEGAQGTLLSIDYGTTKYQTSSDCSIEGLAKGCGLKEPQVDLVLGITKAFYMTRVGNGPFPTKYGGKESEEWVEKINDAQAGLEKLGIKTTPKEIEKGLVNKPLEEMLNGDNETEQGIAVRILGDEYGATTGRLRDPGALDLVALSYAMGINGRDIVLTKVDILSKMKKIKLCTSYTYEGPDVFYAGRQLRHNEVLTEFPRFSEILGHCKPNYETFGGWLSDISGETSYDNLPAQLKNIINFIESETRANVRVISTGAGRNDTVIKQF